MAGMKVIHGKMNLHNSNQMQTGMKQNTTMKKTTMKKQGNRNQITYKSGERKMRIMTQMIGMSQYI